MKLSRWQGGILILIDSAAQDGFQECRAVISLVGPGRSTLTRLCHLIDAPTMATHALKQVRCRIYRLSFEEMVISLLSAGDFTRHCTTGANECTTLHAQPQHAR